MTSAPTEHLIWEPGLRSISIITPLLALNSAIFVFFLGLGKLEKTTLAAVAGQRFVKLSGKEM